MPRRGCVPNFRCYHAALEIPAVFQENRMKRIMGGWVSVLGLVLLVFAGTAGAQGRRAQTQTPGATAPTAAPAATPQSAPAQPTVPESQRQQQPGTRAQF